LFCAFRDSFCQWDERKKTTPYGQAPLLTVNGQELAQSSAIVRFVAQRHGLAGSGDIEAALIDGGYEAVQDIRKAFFTNKADAAKLEQFWSTGFGQALAFLNKNVRGETFFGASNKLSYTDLAIYYLIFVLSTENKEAVDAALAQNAKIQTIFSAVEKDEKIAAYLAKREVTPM